MKKNLNMLKNRSGQTIIESLIGAAILGIMFLILVSGLSALRQGSRNNLVLSSSENQINNIADNIKSGIENYQINYNYDSVGSSANLDKALDPLNLPMAWDANHDALKADCSSCPGTYGYIIQPLEAYRGLYQVTLRMTHKDWEEKGEHFRDYIFMVSTK